MNPAEIVLAVFGIVAKLAPGFLALFSSKQSDEEALEHAKSTIAALHPLDVHGIAEKRREELRNREG